jgi:transketolase
MKRANDVASPGKRTKVEKKPDLYYINTIRGLSVDTVQGANSGHPGMPLGMSPVAHILWTEYLKFDSKDSKWFDRDRFIVSNGHGSALVYSLLHVAGYDLPLAELKRFRQIHSKTPGHPERGVTDGVEVTTGPLGQGLGNAVGMAIAETHLAARFNKPGYPIIDHFTYAFCGDGCLQEGVGQESLSLAGHLGLEKLIIIYDDNYISIDGSTDLSYTEDKYHKYLALGFHCIVVKDGNTDFASIRAALDEARHVRGKPKMIILRTTIGYGASNEGTAKVHGAPLGPDGVKALKTKLGLDADKFYNVPDDVYAYYAEASERGKERHDTWKAMMASYKGQFATEGAQLESFIRGDLAPGWDKDLPKNDKAIATRKASENVLEKIVSSIPNLLGGSADLTESNLTKVKAHVPFQRNTPDGRYLHFGVREHGMSAISNGIAAHGGLIPFCATFLNFIGYALGAVRVTAISKLGVIFVATHDSIGLGEDGPTHQPTELSAELRAMPNLLLIRPADQNETSAAWRIAIKHRETPTVLCLTRQALPPLERSSAEGVEKGGYVVDGSGAADVILVSTGSEVSLCMDAAKLLKSSGINAIVVSMPCTQLFDAQSKEYRDSILVPGVPILAVEVWTSAPWAKYAHAAVALDRWGESAPASDCYKALGFTPQAVAEKATKLKFFFQGKTAPSKAFIEL